MGAAGVGVNASEIWGIEEELVRMRAFDASSKAVPCAYNPYGGKRVQQAWQRYSDSPSPQGVQQARQCARRVPVCPGACR